MLNRTKTFLTACASLAMLALVTPPSIAQPYPTRPVTIVVPFSAGGATDLSARLVSKVLTNELGQPVLIENKPGVGGALGATYVSKAKPDGYTLLWGSASTLAVAPAVRQGLEYDAVDSFEHVSLVARQPHVLVGHPSVAKDFKEFVGLVKSRPGKLSYGSAGNGSVTHLAPEYFKATYGLEILHVPYKGGGPALNDLLGGQIDMVFDSVSILLPHIHAGKLKPYAVTGQKRDPLLPDVPTVAEVLGGDFEAYSFFGMVAPRGTPVDVARTLAASLRKVVASDEVREAMTKLGFEVMGTSPEEFRGFIKAEVAKWSKVAKEKNIVVK